MSPKKGDGSIGLIPEGKRGGADPNPGPKRSKTVRCRVCNQFVPIIAAREGDNHCSAICARVTYGATL